MQRLRVLLLGKSGSGKSSVGNALLGSDAFPVSGGFDATTTRCQEAHNGQLLVVDTPDLAQLVVNEDGARRMLESAFALSDSGFDAILLVMRLDVRLTQEELGVADLARRLLGTRAQANIILVFSHADSVETEAEFRDLMRRQRSGFPGLDNLLTACGDRSAMICAGRRCSQERLDRERLALMEMVRDVAARGQVVEIGGTLANGVKHKRSTSVQRVWECLWQ